MFKSDPKASQTPKRANTYGPKGGPDRLQRPKWYRRRAEQRATTNELINQLRYELWSPALSVRHFRDFSTLGPADEKFEKSMCLLAPQHSSVSNKKRQPNSRDG
jgi:hypothetical protein